MQNKEGFERIDKEQMKQAKEEARIKAIVEEKSEEIMERINQMLHNEVRMLNDYFYELLPEDHKEVTQEQADEVKFFLDYEGVYYDVKDYMEDGKLYYELVRVEKIDRVEIEVGE